MRRLLIMLLLLCTTASAELADLLRWQRVGDPGAFTSSGFHDWRGVSKYRSRPGLHAGYDIAMLAGSAVRTPWSGRVVAIAPWYGEEVGVTLRLDNGWEATFGHIRSTVFVGEVLPVGAVVGTVVVDHVDVKMRDGRGLAVDFGELSWPESSPSAKPVVLSDPVAEAAFQKYTQKLDQVSRLESGVRLGLEPRTSLERLYDELEKLRPLARRHARFRNTELPAKAPFDAPRIESRRPIADLLLLP